MQPLLTYGLLAALCWGTYIIIAKIATSEKYYGVNPYYISLFMLLGIAIVFVGGIIYEGKFGLPESKVAIGLGVLAGALWAFGMLLSLKALTVGVDASRLAPIYNTNTLVTVLLGIIFLHELPSANEIVKVIIGAILIVVGAILVSF